MSLDKQIKAAKLCHENHTVNVEDFKKRVFQKLEEQKELKTRQSWPILQKSVTTFIAYGRKETFKKTGVLITATAASLVLVIGVGVTSPSFAQTLKQMPLIQSVFNIVGGDGLKKAQEKGLVTDIQKIATDKNITVTITEAFYDGSQVSVGYILESPDKLPDRVYQEKTIKINGTLPEKWGAGGAIHRIDDHHTVGVINFSTSESLPDKFKFDLAITKIGDIKGDWSFSFPVVKNDTSNKQIVPMLTKTYQDMTVILEKVTFSVNSTEVVGQLIQPSGSLSTIFEVIDDKGNKIELLSSSAEENKIDREKEIIRWKAIYQPLQEPPKSLTIRPITRDQIDLPSDIVKGLEITIPIQKNS
jgi:hypothetical protein